MSEDGSWLSLKARIGHILLNCGDKCIAFQACRKRGGIAGVKSPFTPHTLSFQDFQVIYAWLSLLYGPLHGSFVENVIFSIM